MRVARLAVFLTVAAVAFPGWAQPVRIGYISMTRIEKESQRPKRDAAKLKQEFAARERQLRELQSEVASMEQEVDKLKPDAPEAAGKRTDLALRNQQFQQARRSFVEDLERRKAEERGRFLRDLSAVVAKVAERRHLDAVVAEAVYASKAIDITGTVLKALDSAPESNSK